MMRHRRLEPFRSFRMLSIIIPTHDSERRLVQTLAALVAGATAGLVREVIVADGGSRDETEHVADIAGCSFFRSGEPLGARLKAGAQGARGQWLMFLRPGVVPAPTWIDETAAFVQRGGGAAAFRRQTPSVFGRLFQLLPHPDQGLILPKALYHELGGHRSDAASPERWPPSSIERFRQIGRAHV